MSTGSPYIRCIFSVASWVAPSFPNLEAMIVGENETMNDIVLYKWPNGHYHDFVVHLLLVLSARLINVTTLLATQAHCATL